MNLQEKIKEKINDYKIYFVSGLPIPDKVFEKEVHGFNMFEDANQGFLELINQLDGLVYGDKKLAMPKWVTLDCALLTNGIVGLAKHISETDKEILDKFELPKNYDGLIPITEYSASPTKCKDNYIGHTCGTLIKGQELGLISKLLGLKAFNVKTYVGVAQYDNVAVKTHSKIANLKLYKAIIDFHEEPKTFIYGHDVDDKLFEKLNNDKNYDFLLDPEDKKQLKEMNNNIISGNLGYEIVNPGQIYDGNKLLIPIKKYYHPQLYRLKKN